MIVLNDFFFNDFFLTNKKIPVLQYTFGKQNEGERQDRSEDRVLKKIDLSFSECAS